MRSDEYLLNATTENNGLSRVLLLHINRSDTIIGQNVKRKRGVSPATIFLFLSPLSSYQLLTR